MIAVLLYSNLSFFHSVSLSGSLEQESQMFAGAYRVA